MVNTKPDTMPTASHAWETSATPLMVVGRYAIYDEIACGGMATVHVGRMFGPVGFTRTVAVKRMHAHIAKDPEFTAMFLDEARLAARVRHPNVVATLDVVAMHNELFLVMEYVHGQSLAVLARRAAERGERIPLGVVGHLVTSLLQGLHAAHEACNDQGEPLGIVHRDVSPQNLLVGRDGVARLADFGVAKAIGRAAVTTGGRVKGKLAYMAPEQALSGIVTRRTDIWGAGVVLWELLTGRRLFDVTNEGVGLIQIIDPKISPPSESAPDVGPYLDAVVMRALSTEPSDRFATALEMATAFEDAIPVVTQREVAQWIDHVVAVELEELASRVARIERLTPAGGGISSDVVARSPKTPMLETVAFQPSHEVSSDQPREDLPTIGARSELLVRPKSPKMWLYIAMFVGAGVIATAVAARRHSSVGAPEVGASSVDRGAVSRAPTVPSATSSADEETARLLSLSPSSPASVLSGAASPEVSAPAAEGVSRRKGSPASKKRGKREELYVRD